MDTDKKKEHKRKLKTNVIWLSRLAWQGSTGVHFEILKNVMMVQIHSIFFIYIFFFGGGGLIST